MHWSSESSSFSPLSWYGFFFPLGISSWAEISAEFASEMGSCHAEIMEAKTFSDAWFLVFEWSLFLGFIFLVRILNLMGSIGASENGGWWLRVWSLPPPPLPSLLPSDSCCCIPVSALIGLIRSPDRAEIYWSNLLDYYPPCLLRFYLIWANGFKRLSG